MKRLFLILACATSLSGCGIARTITSPGQVAAHTAVDEEALKRCEATYKLSRTLVEVGVDAGLIRGGAAVTVAALDNTLYGVLVRCRTAYKLFGSVELVAAADDMDKQAANIGPAIKQGAD